MTGLFALDFRVYWVTNLIVRVSWKSFTFYISNLIFIPSFERNANDFRIKLLLLVHSKLKFGPSAYFITFCKLLKKKLFT